MKTLLTLTILLSLIVVAGKFVSAEIDTCHAAVHSVGGTAGFHSAK